MTVGSKLPNGVLKAAFHSSPSLILMLLYPHCTSNFSIMWNSSLHCFRPNSYWIGTKCVILLFLFGEPSTFLTRIEVVSLLQLSHGTIDSSTNLPSAPQSIRAWFSAVLRFEQFCIVTSS